MHVYLITNLVNGKVYVGQHCHEDLNAYFARQLPEILAGSQRKPKLYAAIRKYGIACFVIKSLVRPLDKDQMDKLEQFFIRTFDSQIIGYNITMGGEGTLGYSHSVAVRARIGAKMRGRKVTDSFRQKISALKKGNKNSLGKKKSANECEAISRRMQGNKNAQGCARSLRTRALMSAAAKRREAAKKLLKHFGGKFD